MTAFKVTSKWKGFFDAPLPYGRREFSCEVTKMSQNISILHLCPQPVSAKSSEILLAKRYWSSPNFVCGLVRARDGWWVGREEGY